MDEIIFQIEPCEDSGLLVASWEGPAGHGGIRPKAETCEQVADIHQTFQLSREPLLKPIERFYAAAGSSPERVAIGRMGQEFSI